MDDGFPKTSRRQDRSFRLGDLEVRPGCGEIRGWHGVQRVRPLLMDLLLRLAAEPGAVVRRETLLEEVWPRRMVNDEVLSRAMGELRGILGDDVKKARYVETLPKIGYRLVAPVAALEPLPASPIPAGRSSRAAEPPRRVLPLRPWPTGLAIAVLGLASVLAWKATHRGDGLETSLERRLHAARPFTSDPGAELGPRFSPGGERVAYALSPNDAQGSRIVVRAIDGTVQAIVGGDDRTLRLSPVFFPDGRRLAYARFGEGRCAIAEWDLDAQRETRELVECARRPRGRFDLSADGRWLVYAAPARPQFPVGLQLLDVQSGTVRTLTSPEPGAGDDLMPRFNADATRVAFFRGNETHRSPWIVEREGTAGPRRVSKLDGLSYGAAWLGRDGPLLVAADWLGFRALNLLDPATGEARLVGGRGAQFPDVARNGAVVYENASYAANVWTLPVSGASGPRELWPSTRYSNQPEFSPDGKRLAFASNRDGTDAIHVADLDGQPVRIAGGDRYRFLRPHWSADGKSVLAVRVTLEPHAGMIQQAVRIAADGSRVEVIDALGSGVSDVRETHEGRWLLWAENAGTAMRLMRSPAERPGAAERLPWPLVSHYQVNGDRVVLAQPQMPKLMACGLAALACEPLEVDVTPRYLYHWALGERSLFIRTPENRVARYDLATRRVVAMLDAAPSGGGTSIAVAPGEVAIAFIKEEGPAIDLMLAPGP